MGLSGVVCCGSALGTPSCESSGKVSESGSAVVPGSVQFECGDRGGG